MAIERKNTFTLNLTKSIKNTMFLPLSCLANTCLFLCTFCVTIFLLDQINLKTTNSDLELNFFLHLFKWILIYCTLKKNLQQRFPGPAFWGLWNSSSVTEIAGWSTDDHLNLTLWIKLLVCVRFYFCWIIKISDIFHFY